MRHDSPRIVSDDRGYRFSSDIQDYDPMCLRCHRLYDKEHITHCPHGHEYIPENTIHDAGKRKCKTCVYARNNERRKRIGFTPEQHARRIQQQRDRRAAARLHVLPHERATLTT